MNKVFISLIKLFLSIDMKHQSFSSESDKNTPSLIDEITQLNSMIDKAEDQNYVKLAGYIQYFYENEAISDEGIKLISKMLDIVSDFLIIKRYERMFYNLKLSSQKESDKKYNLFQLVNNVVQRTTLIYATNDYSIKIRNKTHSDEIFLNRHYLFEPFLQIIINSYFKNSNLPELEITIDKSLSENFDYEITLLADQEYLDSIQAMINGKLAEGTIQFMKKHLFQEAQEKTGLKIITAQIDNEKYVRIFFNP